MAIIPPSPFPLIISSGHTIRVTRYPNGQISTIRFKRNGRLNRIREHSSPKDPLKMDSDFALRATISDSSATLPWDFLDRTSVGENNLPAWYTYYEDGQVEAKRWYIDNELKREGDKPAWKIYYPNGPPDSLGSPRSCTRLSRQVMEKRWYIFGELNRAGDLPSWKIYYPNGQLKEERWYIDGILNRAGDLPAWKIYYPNGPPDSKESQVLQPRLSRQLRTEKWYIDGELKNEIHTRRKIDPKAGSTFASRGKFFGYPSCCIKEFMTTEGRKAKVERERSGIECQGNQTGFVPCKSHQEQLRRGEIILKDLIHNRKCEMEFPNQSSRRF
jgi:antitoxin component YwqK of YwqJK toxin-antitoxin module